jgi:hypothetical protein
MLALCLAVIREFSLRQGDNLGGARGDAEPRQRQERD